MRTSLLDSIGGSFHLEIRKQDLLLFLLLALVASTIMFWRLGEGSLGDYDEADYAQSAREMLWWNDFNTPRWNGMEFFDKPPLGLWLTTLAYKVCGVNEFSARLVSASSRVSEYTIPCRSLLASPWAFFGSLSSTLRTLWFQQRCSIALG